VWWDAVWSSNDVCRSDSAPIGEPAESWSRHAANNKGYRRILSNSRENRRFGGVKKVLTFSYAAWWGSGSQSFEER
jgi:hypothetical protein